MVDCLLPSDYFASLRGANPGKEKGTWVILKSRWAFNTGKGDKSVIDSRAAKIRVQAIDRKRRVSTTNLPQRGRESRDSMMFVTTDA
jgi:hypothetical protein